MDVQKRSRTLGLILRIISGIVVLLSVTALVLVWRAQEHMTEEQNGELKRVQDNERMFVSIRASLNRGEKALTTFLLTWDDHRIAAFTQALQQARVEADDAVARLQADRALTPKDAAELRRKLETYWTALVASKTWTERERQQRSAALFAEEVQPNRRPVGRFLQEHINAEQAAAAALERKRQDQQRARIFDLGAILLVLFCVATCGAVLSYVYWREATRERLEKYGEIVKSKAELEQLSARMIVVQESERKRLSRELHDGIGQILTALRMEISYVQRSASPNDRSLEARLQRARGLAEEALRTVRNISLLLRPTLLDDLGLEPALRWLAEDFAARTKLPCVFRGDNVPERLPEAVKTCVFRIVQESLNNCQKHASATRAGVQLIWASGLLTVIVEDDGYGFEMNDRGEPKHGAGLGLIGMRERSSVLGGTFSIKSAPGRGTKITVVLPFADADELGQVRSEDQNLYADTRSAG